MFEVFFVNNAFMLMMIIFFIFIFYQNQNNLPCLEISSQGVASSLDRLIFDNDGYLCVRGRGAFTLMAYAYECTS